MPDQPKPRFKMTITITKEYDVIVENYSDCDSVEEMRQLDLEFIQEDPLMFIEDDQADWAYELVDITPKDES